MSLFTLSKSQVQQLCLLLVVSFLAAGLHNALSEPVRLSIYKDEPRYVNYALSVVQHGTFGISEDYKTNTEVPSAANTPAYPLLLASFTALSSDLQATLLCVQKDPVDQSGCPNHYGLLLIGQYMLAIITVLAIWLCASQIIPGYAAVLAGLLAIGSGELFDAAREMRTEILILPLFMLLLAAWHRYLKSRRARAIGVCGLLLGLLTLTRPEYLYLTLVFVLIVFAQKNAKGAGLCLLVFACVLAPWVVRNQVQVGQPVLTESSYGGTVLVQRLTYNDMQWSELFASFVYFIPDTGDAWAEALFPTAWYERLDDDAPHGFMQNWGADAARYAHDASERGESLTGYLIREKIIFDPFWHGLTSLALAWRGVFVGKYFGIAGFLALIWFLRRRPDLLLWFIPVGFLVVLHAAVSISIPRYNIMLIGPYAMAIAMLVVTVWSKADRRKAGIDVADS